MLLDLGQTIHNKVLPSFPALLYQVHLQESEKVRDVKLSSSCLTLKASKANNKTSSPWVVCISVESESGP